LLRGLELAQYGGDRYHMAMAHLWLAHLNDLTGAPGSEEHLRTCLAIAVENQLDHLFQSEAEIAVPLLIQALERKVQPAYVAQVLTRIGSEAVEQMLPLDRYTDPEVRRHIITALAGVEDARVARELARHACREDPELRATVQDAVQRLSAVTLPPLTFRCFGPLQVIRGDSPIPESAWRGQRAKRLLRYLLISPDHALMRDQVMDRMWPDLDPEIASRNLYRVIYDLRRALHPGNASQTSGYVRLEGERVRLDTERIAEVDITTFRHDVVQGLQAVRQRDEQKARKMLQRAVELYTDDLFTDDLYDEWLTSERCHLRQQFVTAARVLSRLLTEAGDLEEAILLLQRVLNYDPTDEQACFDLMVYLARNGQRAEALQRFAACKAALEELGLEPSTQLRTLYYRIASSPELPALTASTSAAWDVTM